MNQSEFTNLSHLTESFSASISNPWLVISRDLEALLNNVDYNIPINRRLFFLDSETKDLMEAFVINKVKVINHLGRVIRDPIEGHFKVSNFAKDGFLKRRSNLQVKKVTESISTIDKKLRHFMLKHILC